MARAGVATGAFPIVGDEGAWSSARIDEARSNGAPSLVIGGAYGYNTETSPGPAIPTRESIEKFIPKDHLWPIDDVWNYHAGGEGFKNLKVVYLANNFGADWADKGYPVTKGS